MTGDFTVEIPAGARAIFAVVRPTAMTCRKITVSKSFQKSKRSPITHGQSSKRTHSLICGRSKLVVSFPEKDGGYERTTAAGVHHFGREIDVPGKHISKLS